jgi:hypothetical protein
MGDLYSILALGMLFLGFGVAFMLGFNRDQTDKPTRYYLFGMLFIGLLLFGLVWLINRKEANWEFTYHILQGSMFCLGVFHAYWLYKKLFWSKRNSLNKIHDSFLLEAVFTLLLLLLLTLIIVFPIAYFFGIDKAQVFWSIGILFLLPFLGLKSFDFLNQIPEADYAWKWVFTKDRINEDNWDWQNETWVNFEMINSLNGQETKQGKIVRFKILVPRKTPLREVYRLAIREYNQKSPAVPLQDLGFENGRETRFYWLFSLKKPTTWKKPATWFNSKRILNPYDTIVANEILTDDLIYAQRMVFQEENDSKFDFVAMGEL